MTNSAVCWKTRVSWWYSATVGTLHAVVSDNPQAMRTISREVLSSPVSHPGLMTPQRLHADSFEARVFQAYLQGALHDGTRSDLHGTHRFSQKGTGWLDRLATILTILGHRSWTYQEGKDRKVFVLETSASFLDVDFDPDQFGSLPEQIAYVRGYFDVEGGLPQSPEARFYVQLTQKDWVELVKVKTILEMLGIACGKMHNPSAGVAPDYWRFFIRTGSHVAFASCVGSWRPIKEQILLRKMI
jgi:hypothetical protein